MVYPFLPQNKHRLCEHLVFHCVGLFPLSSKPVQVSCPWKPPPHSPLPMSSILFVPRQFSKHFYISSFFCFNISQLFNKGTHDPQFLMLSNSRGIYGIGVLLHNLKEVNGVHYFLPENSSFPHHNHAWLWYLALNAVFLHPLPGFHLSIFLSL